MTVMHNVESQEHVVHCAGVHASLTHCQGTYTNEAKNFKTFQDCSQYKFKTVFMGKINFLKTWCACVRASLTNCAYLSNFSNHFMSERSYAFCRFMFIGSNLIINQFKVWLFAD